MKSIYNFLAILSIFMFVSCTLPRKSVLFFNKPDPGKYKSKVSEVPDKWQGRMLMVSGKPVEPSVGGTDFHSHGIGHLHKGKSVKANRFERPLGVKETVIGSEHIHNLVSVTTSPRESSQVSVRPRSYGLSAFLFDGIISYKMPEGLIVGYLGKNLPKGWNWCDGTNETPDLRGRFPSIAPPIGTYGKTKHTHNAEHIHTWKSGANQDRPAFAGDITTPRSPIAEFQSRIHNHQVDEMTDEINVLQVTNEPQFVGIRFIQAKQGAKLPSGAILLHAKNKTPLGWDLLSTRFDRSIENRYIKALLNDDSNNIFGGHKMHSHKLFSKHSLTLIPQNDTGIADSVRNGPQIAVDEHGHEAMIEDNVNSVDAEFIPPFVKLTAIIKR